MYGLILGITEPVSLTNHNSVLEFLNYCSVKAYDEKYDYCSLLEVYDQTPNFSSKVRRKAAIDDINLDDVSFVLIPTQLPVFDHYLERGELPEYTKKAIEILRELKSRNVSIYYLLNSDNALHYQILSELDWLKPNLIVPSESFVTDDLKRFVSSYESLDYTKKISNYLPYIPEKVKKENRTDVAYDSSIGGYTVLDLYDSNFLTYLGEKTYLSAITATILFIINGTIVFKKKEYPNGVPKTLLAEIRYETDLQEKRDEYLKDLLKCQN